MNRSQSFASSRLRVTLAFVMAALAWPLAAQTIEEPGLKFFRDLAETRDYKLGRPVSPKITPDRRVIYLRAAPRNPTLRLYQFDLAIQTERELLTPEALLGGTEEQLSPEEKARRERQRQSLRGFTSFQLSKDGTRLLVTLSGELYLVNTRAPEAKPTKLPGAGWIDPRFSPDGNFVAAAKGGELHVIDLATNMARAITTGATETLSHGTSEFIAQEEMSRNEGYWWSPDSRSLLVQETDESGVEVRYIADPLHPERPPAKHYYPRAGSANAVVRLHLLSLDGGKPLPVGWDSKTFPYLAHVRWSKNAPVTILVQNREQTEQVLLAVDAATGKTRELLREKDSAWLNLDDNGAGASGERRPPFWFADGKHFLWTTEQRGAWQVELRDANGKLVREITPVGRLNLIQRVGPTEVAATEIPWHFRSIVGLDEAAGHVLVTGGHDSRESRVWSFPISGDHARAIDISQTLRRDPAVNSVPAMCNASFFPEAKLLVHTSDDWDGKYTSNVVATADWRVVATLRSVAEQPARLPFTRLTRSKSTPAFDAAVTQPRELAARTKRSDEKYPVILYVYAGPASKRVTADIRSYLIDQWMADQGYIVVRIDSRGTPWRGRDWERAIKGNFIDVPLEDQIAGLRALAQDYPAMDLSRVGVVGWSFGGYFSAMAVARRPDIFKSGVAGAPVVTWENYDTHYTERYLGLPQTSPDAYRVSNVTTYASQLTRPLLLIHGLTDDNVYAQHTLQMADALYMAGKLYEFLPMLGTHMISDPLVRLRQQTRIMEFFDRTLKRDAGQDHTGKK